MARPLPWGDPDADPLADIDATMRREEDAQRVPRQPERDGSGACEQDPYHRSHHLIPRRAGRNQAAELTCIYCYQTEKEIRDDRPE